MWVPCQYDSITFDNVLVKGLRFCEAEKLTSGSSPQTPEAVSDVRGVGAPESIIIRDIPC